MEEKLKKLARYYALSQLGLDSENDEIPIEEMQDICKLLQDNDLQDEFDELIKKEKKKIIKELENQ